MSAPGDTVSVRVPDDGSASVTVVRAVAQARGVEPTELSDRLNDVLDPDALDRLFPGPPVEGTVAFPLEGCTVTVRGDATVVVSPGTDGRPHGRSG
jgi:hypothetical protein